MKLQLSLFLAMLLLISDIIFSFLIILKSKTQQTFSNASMELHNIIPIVGFTVSSVWQCEPRNGEEYDVTQLHARFWKGL